METIDPARPSPRTFTSLAEAETDINAEKNAENILGPVTITVTQAGGNAIALTHENEKTPPPPYDPGPSTPTVSVKGEKIWEDDNNSGNTRPASIKIELYRDGGDSPYRTATVSASNNWKYSFTGLTKYRTGNTPYTYTVKEAAVPEGYTSVVSADNKTITNTLIPPERPPATPEEPKEPGDPNDPQNPNEPPVVHEEAPVTPPPTPPVIPEEPPVISPTTPPVTPPTNPNLPQTGTVRDSAPAVLCLALASALAGYAVIFRNKHKNCE